jgi:hypothetical protein
MAIVKTTRVWNGLPVEESTNTDTGVVEIRSGSFLGSQGDLLATGDAKGNWSYNDQAGFRRRYNNVQRNQGKPDLSQEDFNKEFFTNGTNQFNNDRAAVLNNPDNYENKEDYEKKSKAYAESGIPDVKNPETGEKNNSEGDSVSDPDNNEAPESTGGNSFFSGLGEIEELDIGSFPGTLLRYPIGAIPDLGYDFIQFKAHKYKPGNTLAVSGPGARLDLGAALETIILPMIPNISESNSVGWGEDKLNQIQQYAAEVAATTMNTAVKEGGGLGAAVATLVGGTGKAINDVLTNNPGLQNAIIAHFAGQAVGTNVLGRATGAVLNPNLELLFKGPTLRSFNFTFKFRPRNSQESLMVQNIIRTFKRNMAVQRSSSELFLLTPNIFTVKYMYGKKGSDVEEHPFMNRLKPCALTAFTVSYTPDGNYMTYDDGALTGYDVSFTMSEIVPIYADEQQTVGGTGY